jgi:hypothetical protein
MGLAVLLTRATYSTVVQKEKIKTTFANKIREVKDASTMENKQELKDKENNTLEKSEENLKPRTLERKANFREGESYDSQQSNTAVKNFNSGSLLFIGARGGSSANVPRFDRCEVPG